MNREGDRDRTEKGMEIRMEKGWNRVELSEIYQQFQCLTPLNHCLDALLATARTLVHCETQ